MIINSIKMLKYDFQRKYMIIGLLAFSCMAIGYSIGNAHGLNMVGAYFWGPFMGMFPLQSLYNVLYAKSVVASPKFKKYIVQGTVILHSIFMVVMYLLCIVVYYAFSKQFDFTFDVKYAVISFLIVDVGLAIYIQVYYRNALLGILSMIPTMYIILASNNPQNKLIKLVSELSFDDITFMIIGAVGLVICELIIYVVALLLYKIPFSDGVMKRMLSKIR